MDLKLDEQRLVADFRRLDGAGRQELLDYATFLVKKHSAARAEEEPPAAGQCRIERREERPETEPEPIVTE